MSGATSTPALLLRQVDQAERAYAALDATAMRAA